MAVWELFHTSFVKAHLYWRSLHAKTSALSILALVTLGIVMQIKMILSVPKVAKASTVMCRCRKRYRANPCQCKPDSDSPTHIQDQGILKGEVSLYRWPPVWLVWNRLYDYWQFLFLFAKQTNPNQSNRRSTVQWYLALKYSLLWGTIFATLHFNQGILKVEVPLYCWPPGWLVWISLSCK